MEGYWKSVSSEDFHDGTFGTRLYRFENTSWEETIIIYQDRNLLHPLFKISYEGYYDITTKSATIYQTYHINFHYSKKTITVLTDNKDKIKEFDFKSCYEGKDTEVDISAKGCSFIVSIADYPVQYDIVKKEMDLLFLGIHSYQENIDEADKRPNYFHYPLRKFEPKKESEWVKNKQSVYVLINYNVKNDNEIESFLEGYVESMHKYGGIELNYSNQLESFEGEIQNSNIILQIWPDRQQFEKWWNSKDFKPWKIEFLKRAEVKVSLSNKYKVDQRTSE